MSFSALILLLKQVDVLVDKAPLKRENNVSYPVDLERVYARVRADGGADVNRLGVVGSMVQQFLSMVWVSFQLAKYCTSSK